VHLVCVLSFDLKKKQYAIVQHRNETTHYWIILDERATNPWTGCQLVGFLTYLLGRLDIITLILNFSKFILLFNGIMLLMVGGVPVNSEAPDLVNPIYNHVVYRRQRDICSDLVNLIITLRTSIHRGE